MYKNWHLTIFQIFICILCATLCFAQNTTKSKAITIQCQNMSLRSMIKELADQSGFDFVFNDELVNEKMITCNIENLEIQNALHLIFSQFQISYKIYSDGSIVLFREQKSIKPIIKKERPKDDTIHPPILKNKVKLCYPSEAEKQGIEGRVNMSLLVDESGEVTLSKITRSSGHEILDKAAIDYAHKLKFSPAMKNGISSVVWVAWSANFKSPETEFFQCDYAYKLQNLYKLADLYSGEIRNEILQNIILIHNDCIEYLKDKPEIDFNEIIKEVILAEVFEKWRDLWKEWHLHFIVFQDFLLRYPNSKLTSQAIADLLNFLEMDLADIKSKANDNPYTQKKIEYIIKSIESFLNDKFPKSDKIDLLSRIETYSVSKQ